MEVYRQIAFNLVILGTKSNEDAIQQTSSIAKPASTGHLLRVSGVSNVTYSCTSQCYWWRIHGTSSLHPDPAEVRMWEWEAEHKCGCWTDSCLTVCCITSPKRGEERLQQSGTNSLNQSFAFITTTLKSHSCINIDKKSQQVYLHWWSQMSLAGAA